MTTGRWNFDQPDRFVVGTIGAPGEREFYFQIRQGSHLVTLATEKSQASALADRIATMTSEVKANTGKLPEGFLVQEMVTGGTELILGMHRDALGTAILLGMGGVTAELFKDTTMRLLPALGGLSHEEALSMAKELKTWPLLDGFRGRPKADVEALVEAVVAFSQMASQLGDHLIEAEINPIFVLPKGHGVKAADGVAVLSS
jgi:succinyl-CoA synthetase beta subunit